MIDRFHTAQQWRLRVLGAMFGVVGLVTAAGGVTMGLWQGVVAGLLLVLAAGLLIWVGGVLPRSAASPSARRTAFLGIAGAAGCVLLAFGAGALAIAEQQAPAAGADRFELGDGESVVIEGREVTAEIDGATVRLMVEETATGISQGDLVLEEGDVFMGDDWGDLVVVDIAEDVVELAREQA